MSSSLREFNRIYKEYNDIYRDAARKLGLSESAFDILYTICEEGDGCLQRDVCNASLIPKQTVNSSIHKLEQDGYLHLTPGKGRSMHIHLTEKGIQLLEKTIFPVIHAENAAFTELGEAECRQLLQLHTDYIHALRHGIEQL